MSYSFSVRGATKNEVMDKVRAEIDKVVATQPIHAADRYEAESAVEDFLYVLPTEDDTQDVYVSVSGSVGWRGTLDTDHVLTSAGVNVSASLVAKEQA